MISIGLLRHPLFLLRRNRWTRRLLPALDFTVFRRPPALGFPIAVRAFRNRALFNPDLEETRTIEVVRDLARKHPQFTFVDVGANVGFFSFLVLTHNPRARILALEPDPLNARCLLQTLARYPRFRMDVLDWAAAARAGEATFHVDDLSSVTGTLVDERPTADVRVYGGTARTIRVRTETLDALVGDRLEGTTCVKIDVEGAELDVLAGATRLLGEARPWLVIECIESQRAALLALLARHNYEIVEPRLDPNGDVSNVVARPRG